MTDFRALISLLASSSVEFIIVGGAAATAHGSARLTDDLDTFDWFACFQRLSVNAFLRMKRALEAVLPFGESEEEGSEARSQKDQLKSSW